MWNVTITDAAPDLADLIRATLPTPPEKP